MDIEQHRVPVDRLTSRCQPEEMGFRSTEEVEPLEGTVGQERAVRALDFGLGIRTAGYNVFVAGFPGTGRNTTLAAYLRRVAASLPVPDDWCYVHNFAEPSRPMALRLPAGTGCRLAADMEELVALCKRDIPACFEESEYQRRLESVMHDIQEQRNRLSQEMEEEAKRRGVALNFTRMGVMTVPLKPDGSPMGREEFEGLPPEERERLMKAGEELQSYIATKGAEVRRLEKDATQRRAEVDREVARLATEPTFTDLRIKYQDLPGLLEYLNQVQSDMVSRVEIFRTHDQQGEQPPVPEEEFLRYKVNVMVDNCNATSAPVVFEHSPTYYNVFGRVDYRVRMGTPVTDLTMIRPGSIHRSNGGFLVVQARDALSSPLVWDTLKRALRSREARIENLGEQWSAIPTFTLSPEPIPLETKIIMVGNPLLYRMLQLYEEDFRKFFRVKADFDVVMERTPENIRRYAAFVVNRVREEGLRHFDQKAVARLVEYSSRLVEHQNKLTARFADIADLITEANYWADREDVSHLVEGRHVEQAIHEKVYRSNLPEEHIQEYIRDGTIHIQTEGSTVGQVNGISVLDLGDYTFGKPTRITARTAVGRGEVANIEYETRMAGRIHNKGFMTLVGFLMGRFGRDRVLPLRASIGLEQTYDEIEGDSASSAELYALLSSVADAPLRQDLAVTGSVNQHGEIQPVGGVTRKVEGFFDVCKAKGFTGTQGVIIPKDNVANLVLRSDVVQAAQEGRFHVYAVSTIDEGMEVLTDMPAGTLKPDGTYPEGTLNATIEARLRRMGEQLREQGQSTDGARNRRRRASHNDEAAT
ncbi:MAG: AAA family ATPase [Chloroflexi bacterium]|nr:AAA family ATPase [Chloroflexota bacterium]